MKLIARLHDKDIFGFLRNCQTLWEKERVGCFKRIASKHV